jgi:hypothetical protein
MPKPVQQPLRACVSVNNAHAAPRTVGGYHGSQLDGHGIETGDSSVHTHPFF